MTRFGIIISILILLIGGVNASYTEKNGNMFCTGTKFITFSEPTQKRQIQFVENSLISLEEKTSFIAGVHSVKKCD